MSRVASPFPKTECLQSRDGHFPSTVRCTSSPSYFSSGPLSRAHRHAWLCALLGEPHEAPRFCPSRSSYTRAGSAGCRTRTALCRLDVQKRSLRGYSRPLYRGRCIGLAVWLPACRCLSRRSTVEANWRCMRFRRDSRVHGLPFADEDSYCTPGNVGILWYVHSFFNFFHC